MVFTTVKDLFQAISSTTGDAFIITQVSPQAFQEICSAREAANRKFRCSLYTAESRVLIVTIPTLHHEAAHRHLEMEIGHRRRDMGLEDDWCYGGCATYQQMAGDAVITSGEGDSVGQPHSFRPSVDHWPTLVIECGSSHTLTTLRIKASWWFSVSNYEVKVVLLVKLNGPKESMLIEQWKTPQPLVRHGATMTRAAAVLRPQCVQSVSITRNPDIANTHPNRLTPSRYIVHNGPLRLAFADIFLRQPAPGSVEGDIVINDHALQLFALKTWRPVA